jgi:hypothetical protein
MSLPLPFQGLRAKESVMTDYLLLYSGGSMGQLGSSLKNGGNPFTPASKTIANDGSVSDGGASASGYSIISADSLDAAVDLAKGCPVLQGGATITVYETFAVM